MTQLALLRFHTAKLILLAVFLGIKLAGKPGETINAIAAVLP